MPTCFKPVRWKVALLMLVALALYRCGFMVSPPLVNLPLFWSNLATRKFATLSDVVDTWVQCVSALHSLARWLVIIQCLSIAAIVWWLFPHGPPAAKLSAISEK